MLATLTAYLMLTAGAQANGARVLVVVNDASDDSRHLAEHYAKVRRVPESNILHIKTSMDRRVPERMYQDEILAPIKRKLKSLSGIDFILMSKKIPFRIDVETDYSIDALIAAHELNKERMPQRPSNAQLSASISPYFQKNEPFSHKKFGMYLVTRIEGYTFDDCKQLIENSIKATKSTGPFVLDADPTKPNENYNNLNSALENASNILTKKGFKTLHDDTRVFMSSVDPVMGYCSWGSNDASFDARIYKNIKFRPGAIAETFVSTSGRRFYTMDNDANTQSLIADLIKSGVTGVKGYVSEPYSVALARPDILFDRYTSGFNLAESFYMASPLINWKDIIIGDPLCSPYSKK